MVQRQIEPLKQENGQVLKRVVIDAIRRGGCRTVRDVINSSQKSDKSISLEDILVTIKSLEEDNRIILQEGRVKGSFFKYMMSNSSIPFWLTIVVTTLTISTIYLTPQVEPWFVLRTVVGTVFVLLIPGFSLVQLLFPKRMDYVERIALSLVMSLAVTSLTGLVLSYSFWGIRLEPIVASLSAVSIALALGGMCRMYVMRRKL
ncbi:MAG: DUF1616 domain-containing protein [Nitrososphaerales archaeon]